MQKHLQAEDRAQTQKNLLATQTPHSAKGKSSPTPGKAHDHGALKPAAVANTKSRSAPYGTESSPQGPGGRDGMLIYILAKSTVYLTNLNPAVAITINIQFIKAPYLKSDMQKVYSG